MDLSYQTFICVVHQASIGLRDDDNDADADAVAASATEDPAVDISFLESILCFNASKLVVDVVVVADAAFRIRTIDEYVHLVFVCSGKRIS